MINILLYKNKTLPGNPLFFFLNFEQNILFSAKYIIAQPFTLHPPVLDISVDFSYGLHIFLNQEAQIRDKISRNRRKKKTIKESNSYRITGYLRINFELSINMVSTIKSYHSCDSKLPHKFFTPRSLCRSKRFYVLI